ncbi:MAG TPA: glycoside hydrolase family 2 TIM barrel-domain containing protein [Candidatus Sulfotelmatobacter sp.]|nr:glycoside hydrolase family 2 TIM barrel-domain containing protein [Candidatus Sulfotelmatobacter sp.]
MSIASAVLGMLAISSAFCQQSQRSVLLLDEGWQFYPVTDFQAWPAEPRLTADQIKQLTVPALGAGWKPVVLPDDYVVRGTISPDPNDSLLAGGAVCALGGRQCEPPSGASTQASAGALNRPGRSAYGGHGYLPLFPAWYQRNVLIPSSSRGKSIWLDFGGVYRDAVVFVNGKFIDEHPSGYTGFRLNITSAVQFGKQNTIAVFVDPRWFEGWWYEGGGIYRHVRLLITDRLQIAPWGTSVKADVNGTTHRDPASGDHASSDLTIESTIHNDDSADRSFTLVSQVLDPAGKLVASSSSEEKLASGNQDTVVQHVAIRGALLWSLAHPNLYKLRTTIRQDGKNIDQTLTTFGIRTLRIDPEHGFFLNGQHLEIYGVASHQDFPGVGIAAPDNFWSWRIQKLKSMGANAYRTAHNPLPEEFYEAADRMGMLVMDENRHLGDTYAPKATASTPYADLSDLKAMVLQHRNHPSIIMWSLCNEEGQQGTPHGAEIYGAMKSLVKKIDPTRPATAAMHGGFNKNGFLPLQDILGVNYHSRDFAKLHEEFPTLMIYGSEDLNAKSSRGELETSRESGLCSAYGDGPSPNTTNGEPWDSWVPIVQNPFLAGEFIWTGFDYRGEPNPFSWPAVTSQTGAMDLCGFPKPVYYYWKTVWEHKPSVYLFPHWTFPSGTIGQNVRVRIFSNCDHVELLLNGKSLGVREISPDQYLDWEVPYAPGTLTAVASNHGREAARYKAETTGAPAALRLVPEIATISADGEAVAPIRVEVVDAKGRVVPEADNLIRFSVSGTGALAGVANGNPASHESNVANERHAFHGLCMVLARATDHPGAITVVAHADGLRDSHVVLRSVSVAANVAVH